MSRYKSLSRLFISVVPPLCLVVSLAVDVVAQIDEVLDEQVEDTMDEQVEDTVDEQIEDTVDEQVEDTVDEQIEDTVDEQVEDTIDEQIEDTVDEQIEDIVDEQIEETVDEQVEDNVDEQIEHSVEEQVEAAVEDEVENQVENELEDRVESFIERNVGWDVAGRDVKYVEAHAIDDRQYDYARGVSSGSKGARVQKPKSSRYLDSNRKVDEDVQYILEGLDGHFYLADEWVLLGDESTERLLREQGLEIKHTDTLPALGATLFYIKPAKDVSLEALKAKLSEKLGDIEYNSIYFESDAPPKNGVKKVKDVKELELLLNDISEEYSPKPVSQAHQSNSTKLRIGVVDSAIVEEHPLLTSADIHVLNLVAKENAPTAHGTAILSLLAAQSNEVQGVYPDAQFFCASVFFKTSLGRHGTSVAQLIKAIDWMVLNNIDIINMSLSGPENTLLRKAVTRAEESGVLLVAAAGNGGQLAPPAYPAAYSEVYSVTAVSNTHTVYFNANQGDYIDFAALGVNVRHADVNDTSAVSSGTSYATPVVTAMAARFLEYGHSYQSVKDALIRRAIDLGPAGKDPVFGYGLINASSELSAN